jgi:hypothetical protein
LASKAAYFDHHNLQFHSFSCKWYTCLIPDITGNGFSFPHFVWNWLKVCHVLLLLCSGTFLLFPIASEYLTWNDVEFVNGIFFIYWDDHGFFLPNILCAVLHVLICIYIEPSLHSCNVNSLIILYDLLNVLFK